MGVFGAVNVGDEACWWDYGMLRLYRTNNRLLTSVRYAKCRVCFFYWSILVSVRVFFFVAVTAFGELY